ncbi:MAG: hypothetical protein ACREBI_04545 [Nitrosotalea sp.]
MFPSVISYYKQEDIRSSFIGYVMRTLPIIGGALLVIISTSSYYYAPHFLSDTVHSFAASMSGGGTNGLSMLRQMGYPSLHAVISVFQYSLIGLAIVGLGGIGFGLITKKIPKVMTVKVVAEEVLGESHSKPQSKIPKKTNDSQASSGDEQVDFKVVNDSIAKLETELKNIKTGYEEHRQQLEDEKKKLEQRERERMEKN